MVDQSFSEEDEIMPMIFITKADLWMDVGFTTFNPLPAMWSSNHGPAYGYGVNAFRIDDKKNHERWQSVDQ